MENGSIVHIDYDLYNADDETLIETTREAVAKEADQYDENRTYKPLITVIGDGRLIAGFESFYWDTIDFTAKRIIYLNFFHFYLRGYVVIIHQFDKSCTRQERAAP